jgi:hypothetical protein
MRMIRRALLGLALCLGIAGLGSGAAQAQHFVDGFLAQCTAVGAGTCTESTATGYARQQIFFRIPAFGVSPNEAPFTFGPSGVGTFAGHGVYTALTGGTLIMVVPFATTMTFSGGMLDRGDDGSINITYAALTTYGDAGFYAGTYTTGATIGTAYSGAATVTAGQALTIDRGFLKPPA